MSLKDLQKSFEALIIDYFCRLRYIPLKDLQESFEALIIDYCTLMIFVD